MKKRKKKKKEFTKLSDIRLVDHPKGRDAMIGWAVRVPEGVGTIQNFVVKVDDNDEPQRLVAIDFFDPPKMINKPQGYRPDEIDILGTKAYSESP